MITSLYWLVGVVDTFEGTGVLCGHCIGSDWVEQWICIKFCIKLEDPSAETIQWFRRPQLWATGDWQLHQDNVPTHASHLVQSFMAKHQIIQVTQSLYSPDLAPYKFFLTLPKTKVSFEREEISDCQWDSGKYNRAADGDWENCVRSQGAYFEGDVTVLRAMFLISRIFFNKCLHSPYDMAGHFLDRPRNTHSLVF